MTRLKTLGGLTAVGALAIGLISSSEGLRTKAYRDVVGVPTICFGETRGVHMGDVTTAQHCKDLLGDAILDYETGMTKCLKDPDAIPAKSYAAFLSFTYNVGPNTFCKSSVAKRINDKDIKGACNALMLYTKAHGQFIQGLYNRRLEERKMCLEDAS